MRYLLSKNFTKIAETTGTIQNTSKFFTLEMSTSEEKYSGFLIAPLQTQSFKDMTIYLRCVDGQADARIVPFVADSSNTSSSSPTSTGEQDFDIDDIWNGNETSFSDWDSELERIFGN